MQGTEDQPGVIPLAIEECFSYVSSSNDDRYDGHAMIYVHVIRRTAVAVAKKEPAYEFIHLGLKT